MYPQIQKAQGVLGKKEKRHLDTAQINYKHQTKKGNLKSAMCRGEGYF